MEIEMVSEKTLIETLRKMLTSLDNFKKLDKLDAILMTRMVHWAFNSELDYFDHFHSKDMNDERSVKANIDTDYPIAIIDDGNSISVVKVADKNDDYYEFLFDGFKNFDMNYDNLYKIFGCMAEYQYMLAEYNFD